MENIYILGGSCRRDWTPNLVYESCVVFDIEAYVTERFRETSAMLFGREKSACSVFGGRIVVSGGEIDDGWFYQGSTTVEVYDHCANEWSRMPDMLQGRFNHASVSIRNKLYMIGGTLNRQCEVFDSFSNKFAYIKPVLPIYKFDWIQTQYVTIGDKIKIYNGRSLDAAVFDVEKEEWSEEKGLELNIDAWGFLYC